MSNWTEKHMNHLQNAGKIRGFVFPKREIPPVGRNDKSIPKEKPKALIWLDWNLLYWCNEKALSLEKEYKFCPERGWRFDFAVPSMKWAIEYEGGIFLQKSGHNTAKHYTKDTDKYNRAAVLGWRVIRVTAMNYTTVLKTLSEMVKASHKIPL